MILAAWGRLFGILTVETALVFLCAWLVQRCIKSGVWRRTIWQISIFALAVLMISEITGIARGLGGLLNFRQQSTELSGTAKLRSRAVDQALRVSEDFRQKVNERVAFNRQNAETDTASAASPDASMQEPGPEVATANSEPLITAAAPVQFDLPAGISHSEPVPAKMWWPGIIWFLGAAIFAVRSIFIRSLLLIFRMWNHASTDAELKERVRTLASRLGIRHSVRLMEFPRIAAPVAFGVIWPTIGLPRGFARTFSSSQQNAMLAHELAHLAARDPLWHGLADFVAAALWWHPLAWLSRRQLHSANESAADEASVVMTDGPKVLAECLVELGGRLTKQRSLGWLSMAGFRSDLGHRVERLLQLQDNAWTAPGRMRTRIVKATGPLALVATGIVSTAWIPAQSFPDQLDIKGESSMKTIKQYWLSSVANVVLVAALGNGHSLFAQAQPDQPKPEPAGNAAGTSRAKDVDGVQPAGGAAPEGARSDASPAPGVPNGNVQGNQDSLRQYPNMSEEIKRRYGLGAVPGAPSARPFETMPPEMRQRYGLDRFAANEPNSDAMLKRYGVNAGKPSAIQAKLERIVLSEVTFDALPLAEVLKFLFDESKKRDPDKEGINFLITGNMEVPMQTVDPATGLPAPPPAAIDMNSATVRFNLPLRNVRLIDVLNAIVKVADQPVRFSVEEFGVVFSPDTQSPRMAYLTQPIAAEPNPIKIRTFKVDPNAFLQGLEGTFGIGSPGGGAFGKNVNALRRLELQLTDAEETERQTNKQFADKTATSDDLKRARIRVAELESQIEEMKEALRKQSAEQSMAVQDTLRRLFNKLGVNMDAPKAVFYNPVTGIVMVKVSAKDMEVVQAALETLGGTPISLQQTAGVPGAGGLPGVHLSGGLGSTDKLPVLGDLPFVGRLFRSENRFGDGAGDESRR